MNGVNALWSKIWNWLLFLRSSPIISYEWLQSSFGFIARLALHDVQQVNWRSGTKKHKPGQLLLKPKKIKISNRMFFLLDSLVLYTNNSFSSRILFWSNQSESRAFAPSSLEAGNKRELLQCRVFCILTAPLLWCDQWQRESIVEVWHIQPAPVLCDHGLLLGKPFPTCTVFAVFATKTILNIWKQVLNVAVLFVCW